MKPSSIASTAAAGHLHNCGRCSTTRKPRQRQVRRPRLLKNANIAPARSCRCARTPAPRSSWARRASGCGPAPTMRGPVGGIRRTFTETTCATARWRPCRCMRRSIPRQPPGPDRPLCRAGRAIQIPVHRQGGGSANKTSLSAVEGGVEPKSLLKFVDEKLRTSARRLSPTPAIVIGAPRPR